MNHFLSWQRIYRLLFSLFFYLLLFLNVTRAEVIPFEDVFIPTITQKKLDEGYETKIKVDIPAGYYLYDEKLRVDDPNGEFTIQRSPSEQKKDPHFGQVGVYDHAHPVLLTLQHTTEYDEFIVYVQGCQENVICYPPEDWLLSVLAGGDIQSHVSKGDKGFLRQIVASEKVLAQSRIASEFQVFDDSKTITAQLSARYWTTLPWLLLLGVGLSFTACVYPLIPIVSGLIIGKSSGATRSYALIATYVFGMGLAMAVLGAVFGLFNQLNLQALLQKPVVIVCVALFFIFLSLSMFEYYTLQTPSFLQHYIDKLGRQQQSGSFVGALILGALSILVVSPCATPVLTGLLIYSTQTTPLHSALALFVFGLGTGLPLFLFAGFLRRFMPKAGSWMVFVKKIYGWMMLAVAVWLFARILPVMWQWLLWLIFAVAFAIFLFFYKAANAKMHIGVRVLGGLVCCFAFFCVMQLRLAEQPSQSLQFKLITNEADLETVIADSAQPVIVDFYADWCVACQVWEKKVWQMLRQEMSSYQQIKIDVTDYNDEHKAIFQRLDLVGPPAVLVYTPYAHLEAPQAIFIGEEAIPEFEDFIKNGR